MTPQARPAFELLRFTAAPVGDALALVDVEGRFGATGRFARQPALVVEPEAGQRLELAPVHVDAEGERWRAAYALPVASLVDARFGLAWRGTLVELPEPDRLEGTATPGDRTVQLVREANALRRQLERAEAQAAQAEDHAQAVEERAAEADERAMAAQARVGVVERAARELEQRILVAEGEAEDAERRAEVARERARRTEEHAAATEARVEEAEERAAAAEARVEEAEERAAAADARAEDAERRAAAAEDGLHVLRAELAEERDRAERLARRPPPDVTLPLDPVRPLAADDEDLYEDDDADDDDPDRTPPGGIVRTQIGPVHAPRPVPVARPRPSHRLERWLAVIALLLLVAVVAALVFGLRA